MRTALLTFGLALVLTVAFAVVVAPPGGFGYALGRGVVPLVLGGVGLLWRRRPVLGYWLVFVAAFLLMAVGAQA